MRVLVMSKRKASYDLTFQVESSQVRGGKDQGSEFNVDPRRNSETVMVIAWFFLY